MSKYKNLTGDTLIKTGHGTVKGLFCSASSSGNVQIVDGLTDNDDVIDAATGTLTSSGAMVPGAHATSEIVSSGACAPAVYAESVVTANTVIDGNTVTIGETTYTAKTALTTDPATVAYEVLIGGSDAAFLDNLKLAINGGAGIGTNYSTGTVAHPDVIATTNADTTQKVVARVIGTAANDLDTTSVGGTLTWADTTLGGGTGDSTPGVATTAATVTIGSIVYTAVTSLAQTHGLTAIPYQVLWETSEAVFLDNLKLAINGDLTGDKASTGTVAHPTVIATTNTNTVQTVVARTIGTAANATATTTTLGNYAWADTTLGGGTGNSNPGVATSAATITINGRVYTVVQELTETSGATAVVDQILYGGSEAVMLDNLKLAINAGATAGVNYSTGTVVNADVTAEANDNTSQVIQAKVAGVAGNAITTTETMANHAWGAATLTGGLEVNKMMIESFPVTAGSFYPFSTGEGLHFETGCYLRLISGTAEVTVEYD